MKKYFSYLLLIVFSSVLFAGCGKRKPQLPSNKKQTQVDSTMLAMLEFNQTLVEKADAQLAEFVTDAEQDYVRHELGFWYKKTQSAQGDTLAVEQIVNIHYTVSKLDSTICEDVIETITLGKKQTIACIEAMLLEMCIGEQVEILSPWYLAYGQAGKERSVDSYEQVWIKLSVN